MPYEETTSILAYESLIDAFTKLRRKNWSGLAEHPIAELSIVKQQIRQEGAVYSDEIGRTIRRWLDKLVEEMSPDAKEGRDTDAYRQYYVLKQYDILGKSRIDVMQEVGISESNFYQAYRRPAVENLLQHIRILEEVASGLRPHNLEEREWLYADAYIARYYEEDGSQFEYLEELLKRLQTPSAPITIIAGGPGFGKTKLAREAAKRSYADRLYDAAVIVWIEQKAFSTRQYGHALDYILDKIGRVIGNRAVQDESTTKAKMDVILEELGNCKALIILDQLEPLNKSDIQQLETFLLLLPKSCHILATARQSGLLTDYVENEIILTGMREEEAMQYMRLLVSKRKIIPSPTEADLQRIYGNSYGGIPSLMRALLGPYQIESSAYENNQVQLALERLMEGTYQAIAERDFNAILALHALRLFHSPAEFSALRAATGLNSMQCGSALTLLFKAFLIEHVVDQYGLLPYTDEMIGNIQEKITTLPDSSESNQIRDIGTNLAAYYINELKEKIIGQRVKYVGQEKATLIGLLIWCQEHGKDHELINLVDLIGRPLGIIGRRDARLEWAQAAMEACERLQAKALDEEDEQASRYFGEKREWFKVHDVAWSYRQMGSSGLAQRRMEESLRVAEENNYQTVRALVLRNIAQLVLYSDPTRSAPTETELRAAVSNLEESIKIWEEEQLSEWKGHTEQVLGSVFAKLGLREEALDAFRDAYASLEGQEHIDGMVSALSDMSLVLFDLDREREAVEASDNALNLAKTQLESPAPVYGYALWRRAQLDARRGIDPAIVTGWGDEAISTYQDSFASAWGDEAKAWMRNYRTEHFGSGDILTDNSLDI